MSVFMVGMLTYERDCKDLNQFHDDDDDEPPNKILNFMCETVNTNEQRRK